MNETLLTGPRRPASQDASTVEIQLTEFDQRHYVKLIRARGETIRRVVAELRQELGLRSALDAGSAANRRCACSPRRRRHG